MPIYEYQCENCGERSSALLARFDADDPPCPNCGQPRLHRLVSTFATRGRDDGDDDFGGGMDDFGPEAGGGMDDLGPEAGGGAGDDEW